MPTFAGELINTAVGVASLDDTALRGSYQVVADITARNAIAGSDFDKEGMRVYVQSSKELWLRTASTWKFLKSYNVIDTLLNPDFLERIYISSTGNDLDNDGSLASPYASPDRAVKKIGDGSKGYFAIIPLDDGPFSVPEVVELVPALGQETKICFFGRVDVVDATLPAPVSGSLVAGKATQYDTTSSGYSASIGNGTHWFTDDIFGVDFLLEAMFGFVAVTLAGVTSPTIRAVTASGGIFGSNNRDLSIYPISTVYTTSGNRSPIAASNPQVELIFTGIKFSDSSGQLFYSDPSVRFYACDGSGLLTRTFYHSGTAFVVNCRVGGGRTASVPGAIVGGILEGYFPSLYGYMDQCTFIPIGGLQAKIQVQRSPSRLTFGNIDFTGNTSFNYNVDGGIHQVILFGNQTTTGTVGTHFRSEADGNVNLDCGSSTITGTGVAYGFEFFGPSVAQGIASAASGTLTSSTADVVVGNAGNFTYASLPQNDFTAVTGRGTVIIS